MAGKWSCRLTPCFPGVCSTLEVGICKEGVYPEECPTTVPEDVNLCWDSISSGACHPDLDKGMSEVFRDRDVELVLVGQEQCGSRVGILPVKHLLEKAKSEFVCSVISLGSPIGEASYSLPLPCSL